MFSMCVVQHGDLYMQSWVGLISTIALVVAKRAYACCSAMRLPRRVCEDLFLR